MPRKDPKKRSLGARPVVAAKKVAKKATQTARKTSTYSAHRKAAGAAARSAEKSVTKKAAYKRTKKSSPAVANFAKMVASSAGYKKGYAAQEKLSATKRKQATAAKARVKSMQRTSKKSPSGRNAKARKK